MAELLLFLGLAFFSYLCIFEETPWTTWKKYRVPVNPFVQVVCKLLDSSDDWKVDRLGTSTHELGVQIKFRGDGSPLLFTYKGKLISANAKDLKLLRQAHNRLLERREALRQQQIAQKNKEALDVLCKDIIDRYGVLGEPRVDVRPEGRSKTSKFRAFLDERTTYLHGRKYIQAPAGHYLRVFPLESGVERVGESKITKPGKYIR